MSLLNNNMIHHYSAMYSLSDPVIISQHSAIDDQIVELQKAVSELRYKRNTLLPVSALCPEVLLHILEFAAQEPPGGRDGPLRRLRLSQVCRRWRDILLAASSFWSNIRPAAIYQEALWECFLGRSRSAPLHLLITTSYNAAPHFVEKFLDKLEYSQRLTSLSLSLIYGRETKDIWNALEAHRLPLAHLEIVGDFFPTTATAQSCRKLSTLFPLLRSLKVYENSPAVEPLEFPDWALPHTLTSLDMTYQSVVKSSWTAILEALRPLQNLRLLHLRKAVASLPSNRSDMPVSSHIPSDKHLLVLPHLQSLTLKSSGESNIQLLQSMVLPALTQVDVDLGVENLYTRAASILHGNILPPLSKALLSLQHPRSAKAVLLRQIADTTRGYALAHGRLRFNWSTNFVCEEDYMDPAFPTCNFERYTPHSTLTLSILQANVMSGARGRTQRNLDKVYSRGISGLEGIKIFICEIPAFDLGVIFPKTIRAMSDLRILCFDNLALAFNDLPAVFAKTPDDRGPLPHLHTLQLSFTKITPENLEILVSILLTRQTAGMNRLRLIFVECFSCTVPLASLCERLNPLANVQILKADGSDNLDSEWLVEDSDSDDDNSDEDNSSRDWDENTDDLDNYEVTFDDLNTEGDIWDW